MTFEFAMQKHRPELQAYASRLTRNDADAKDLVQDTLMQAWQAWESFVDGNVRAWLFSIMRNRFISKYRRTRRIDSCRQEVADLWAVWAVEAQRAQRSVTDMLAAVDADLAPGAVAVLQRYYDEDLTGPELAQAEGIAKGTACSSRFRSQRTLRASAAVREYARVEYGLRAEP